MSSVSRINVRNLTLFLAKLYSSCFACIALTDTDMSLMKAVLFAFYPAASSSFFEKENATSYFSSAQFSI